MKEGKFDLEDIRIAPLSKIFDISNFDCGDGDLNEFLKKDAFGYQTKLLAKIFLIIYQERVIGFFSLSTDAIKLKTDEIERKGNLDTSLCEYPSMKIGRLAVDKNFQSKGLGHLILKIAVGTIRKITRSTGCRFITVDSYHAKIGFYEKAGFIINEHDKYKKKFDYVSMRFDLFNPKPEEIDDKLNNF